MQTVNYAGGCRGRRLRRILDFKPYLCLTLMKMITPERTIPNKLASLNKSKFRTKFKLSQKDREYISNKGLETIKDHAYQFINTRVAPAFPKNDGKQTP
jgi:hypothetical protein